MKRKFAIKCMPFIFLLTVLLFFSEIKSKHRNLPSTKNGVRVYRRWYNGSSYRSGVKKKLGDGIGKRSSTTFLLSRMRNGRKNKIVLKYFIKRNNHSTQFKCRVKDKVTKFILHENTFDKKGEDIFYNQMNGDSKKANSAYRKDGNEYLNEGGGKILSYGKKNISKEDEVTYKYVEEMELKKINIRGVDIQYRVYNLEEGIYIVDDENYEKIKKLWNKEELKKAKENFEESFDIKKQGIKEKDWIMLPFDYEENKNIKLVKADFDNPSYDYILTYYDKERNYYWEYKRRNYYKMFRGTIHEIPPYKSELEEDKRFYGKEIIIPKKKLDNKIFRQPMLSDVLTGGCSKEPIGIESWRYVKYPYGNLIENQKYSQLYCIKKNEKDKPNMRYYYLGNSNLAVSEICLGTMNFGNYIQEKVAHELFDYAYEEFQVNFFDTAEIYPLPVSENYFGQSEEILGNWIKSKGKANRHKIVLATKICGRTNKIPWARKFKTGNKVNINDPTDSSKRNKIDEQIVDKDTNSFDKLIKLKKKEELYLNKNYEEIEKMEESENHLYQCDDKKQDNVITLSKDTILASVDNCLKRLKTNYIDLLQLHWPDRYYPNQSSGDFSDVLYDYTKYSHDFIPFVEQLQAIDELKKKGKIREWGLSNETPFGLLKFYELCVSDFLQLRENLYSLTENVLFTDKLEREINALHWKFRDPIRIIQ
ncbi:aldehyde reductase, putative [Plasmodium ovale wallikeri]|uniref:Aldehyde reductase, putative n=1 Tax=Plasmodium ovale wallikeri TaxID=864142 RepID=A0A1A8YYS3_PLAOA|nr:aldehyde reductase, putative [Plasmodium ovale wallikeri]SBT37550.1 aldehyde reductase, putative [Plasmodium ovale wallikeri]